MSAQGGSLNTALKNELRANNWKIKIDGATFNHSESGHVNAQAGYTAVVNEGPSTVATPARWLYLFPLWGQVVWAINGFPPIFLSPVVYTTEANVTIFENKSGDEILTFHEINAGINKSAEVIQKAIRAHTR